MKEEVELEAEEFRRMAEGGRSLSGWLEEELDSVCV